MVRAAAYVIALSLHALAAAGTLVLSKRTMAATNGTQDLAFFSTWFGRVDPQSTSSPALTRSLGLALPDNIGIHFPTSTVTPAVATLPGGETSSLEDQHRKQLRLHGDMSRYNSFMDAGTWGEVHITSKLTRSGRHDLIFAYYL